MRRGSWARVVLFLTEAHQQAATAATRTAITDAVEVQYSQAGPTGCPQAIEGFALCSARAMTADPRLTAGIG
jgi:hypothetical protein